MPYIKQDRRENLLKEGASTIRNAGELNFFITKVVTRYIAMQGLNYQAINDAIGALECAKQELYRRVAGPYEDVKREENGEVYENQIVKGEKQ